MNFELLNDKIAHSGMTITVLAESLSLSRQGLYNKLDGKNEFTGSEIKRLCSLLKLTKKEISQIFFVDDVDK